MSTKKTLKWIIFLFVASAFLTGPAPFAQAQIKPGGTIIEAMATEPTNLNTLKMARRPEYTILHLMFEPLFCVNQKLEIEPLLVDSYETSPDGLVWTFVIKKGIQFHDGTPLNAEAVKFSLEKDREGSQGSRISAIKEIKVVDELTVEITLKNPYPVFLNALANPSIVMFSPTAYKEAPQDWGSKVLVGTGPFMFVEWKSGDRVIMKKNSDYHHGPSFVKNKGPAYVDQWIVRFIPEQATLIAELTSGDVDLSDYVTERDIHRVKSSKNTDLVTAKSTSAIYIAINCDPDNKPLNDPKMRSALAHAINAQAVRKAALSGVGDPLYTYISSQTMGFYKPAEEIAKPLVTYDPAKAKAILDELGWKDSGKGYREKDGRPLEVKFLAFSIPRYKRIAEVATPMLEKAGFRVDLQILEAGNLYEKTLKGEHDLLSTAYVGGSGIALDDLVASMHSKNLKSNVQWAHFSNPEMDRLLDTASFDLDPEKRKAALDAAQEMAAREIPCIPIANALELFGFKKDIGVENYITHPWAFDQADEWRGLEVYRK